MENMHLSISFKYFQKDLLQFFILFFSCHLLHLQLILVIFLQAYLLLTFDETLDNEIYRSNLVYKHHLKNLINVNITKNNKCIPIINVNLQYIKRNMMVFIWNMNK